MLLGEGEGAISGLLEEEIICAEVPEAEEEGQVADAVRGANESESGSELVSFKSLCEVRCARSSESRSALLVLGAQVLGSWVGSEIEVGRDKTTGTISVQSNDSDEEFRARWVGLTGGPLLF